MGLLPTAKILILIPVLIFLTACEKEIGKSSTSHSSSEINQIEPKNTPSKVIQEAEPTSSMCPDAPKILRSTNKFLKIDHAMSQFEEAKNIAANWCGQFNLSSDFSTQKCDKCCESNFQCR